MNKDTEILDYIKKNFVYKKDGTLERKDRKNSTGSLDKDGYLIIKIKTKQYKAHRIVFAMHNDRFPNKEIDHINRIRTDNRIENLREVDRTQNVRNSTIPFNKETGVIGVHLDNRKDLKKKYTTKLGGKTYRFYTVEEAIEKRSKYYECI